MNHAYKAGYTLVVSIVMAWVVQIIGDNFDFTDNAQLQDLVDVLPVIVLIIGLLVSFQEFRHVTGGAGGRGM